MAKFLNTTGVSYHLQEIIDGAKTSLILISPYLKINDRIKQSLEDKDRMKIDIRIVYGKSELQPDQVNWLKSLESIRTSYCENLHSKCYLNENAAIVTSMNLYEFSQVNNHEMGILVLKEDDSGLFEKISEEAWRLIRGSELVRLSVEKVVENDSVSIEKKDRKKKSQEEKGFCIRCAKEIKVNLDAPYCGECYKVWKKYENPIYEEKYCHICGKENKSSLSKPVCYDCYKKNK